MFRRTTLFGVCLTLIFLVLVLWKIDLDKLSASLAAANYWYLLPASLVTFAGYVLRTLRWGRMLRPTHAVAVRQLFPILMIGFMANNVLPARAGELVRAYVLHRRASVSKTLGLATIGLERLLDGLTLVILLGLLSLRFPLPEWGTGLARSAGVLFLGTAVLVGLLLLRPDTASDFVAWLADRLPRRIARRSNAMFEAVLLGLQSVRRRRALFALAVLSVLVWLAEGTSYFLIVRGFDLALPAGAMVLAPLFLLVVVNLGIMLPSAPGYVGTFQAFAVLALSAFGVQREAALGVGVISHGMQYLLVTGLGLLFLWRSRLSLEQISAQEGARSAA